MNKEKLNINNEPQITEPGKQFGFEAIVIKKIADVVNKIFNEHCNNTIAKLPDNSVDLVFTSPPYFNARDYSQYENVADYMNQMEQVFAGVERILKPSRMCVINISPVLVEREKRSEQSYRIPLPFYFVPMMEKIGFEFLEDIIWKKPDGAAINRNAGFFVNRKPVAYKPNIVTEYVLVFKKKANFLIDKVLQENSFVSGEYERTNVWEIQPETSSWHPAPFPQKLAENVIRYYSYENEIVYDPFVGSGTTCIVAGKLNRKWIGSEIKKEYSEATLQTINQDMFLTNSNFSL
jgi:DNA modification methylase